MQQIPQILLGSLNAVRQGLTREDAEEAFNHMHPGGVRGGVVKMHARMLEEPLFGRCVFVDVEVIQDDVKFPQRVGLEHVVHETQEVHGGSAIPHMRDYFPGGDLQCGD